MDSFFHLEELVAKLANNCDDAEASLANNDHSNVASSNHCINSPQHDNRMEIDLKIEIKPKNENEDTGDESPDAKDPLLKSDVMTSGEVLERESEGPLSKKRKTDESLNSDDEEYEIYNNYSSKNDSSMNGDGNEDNAYEFDILDEFEGGLDDGYDKNDGDEYQSDSDIPEDEIDNMLEESLVTNSANGSKKTDELAHEEKQKIVLKARGHDHFDVLPEGWIVVTHNSGMPVYLQKQTRVCTMAKPYFLGSGSARKHEIPISAVPCFQYRKELDKEQERELAKIVLQSAAEEEKEENIVAESTSEAIGRLEKTDVPKKNQALPPAKVESVQESQKEHSLEPLAIRAYCQRLFEFQAITVRRFKTWAGRRKHQKMMKQAQRPSLPESTKLITCPLPPTPDKAQAGGTTSNGVKREFIMNPCGKSYVCILHEYVQHAMRMQPRYVFKELENASTPYGATVVINDMEYGSGLGSSKKQAKSEAARVSLEILIPQLKQTEKSGTPGAETHQQQQQDVAFFDEVGVEDNRVSELCAKAGQPSPYQILLECLKRNYGMGDTQIKFEMNNLKHQKNEFKMTVGKHEATVICKNKRDGKQRASQSILQKLHPHINSWGSLLRLYGKGSCKTLKEKKEEEQRITELQSKACANRPNNSILNKLKEEMEKLREKREAVRPIGKFIPEEMDLPSSSSSNLKNVEL